MSRTYDTRDPEARARGIDDAVAAVQGGDLVVLPTDTVYGIGCDAFSAAVGQLLDAKGRGRDMPVPVLVGSWTGIDGLVDAVGPSARRLTEAFWPGALTLVVRHSRGLAWDLGDTDGTVAVRMPLHPVAIEVLRRTGPMGVSSANRSGQPPATTAALAREQLGDSVAVYLEAGDTGAPVPSTIVDCSTGGPPRVIRLGAVSLEQLRRIAPDVLGADGAAAPPPGAPPRPAGEPAPPAAPAETEVDAAGLGGSRPTER